MSTGDWISIGYGIVAIPVWWMAAGVIAWNEMSPRDTKPDGEWVLFGAFVGLLLAGFWPITLAAWAVKRFVGHNDWSRLIYTPSAKRDELREALLEERERRIDQAERELQIGPYKR